jgi:hypothetical protein
MPLLPPKLSQLDPFPLTLKKVEPPPANSPASHLIDAYKKTKDGYFFKMPGGKLVFASSLPDTTPWKPVPPVGAKDINHHPLDRFLDAATSDAKKTIPWPKKPREFKIGDWVRRNPLDETFGGDPDQYFRGHFQIEKFSGSECVAGPIGSIRKTRLIHCDSAGWITHFPGDQFPCQPDLRVDIMRCNDPFMGNTNVPADCVAEWDDPTCHNLGPIKWKPHQPN